MRLLYILLFLLSLGLQAKDCLKHPIYCQILKNSPRINKKHALRVSNIIYKMHRKYKIPSKIFTAILRQENNYRLSSNREQCGYTKEGVKQCIYTDFGISQIYWANIDAYKLDLKKLNTDLEYSIEAGAVVLRDKMKRFKKKEREWYLRYNCGNRGSIKKDTCQTYKRKIERYY